MPESRALAFNDPDDFRANLREVGIELVLSAFGDFEAHLTRVELRHLRLLYIREERPRIAYVSLAPELAFVAFAAQPGRPVIWGGVQLQPGDVVFRSQGERMHQRTSGV